MFDEFVDQTLKELSERKFSLIGQLIKADASQHDRTAGRIQAIAECEEILRQKRKTWTSKQEREDE